MRFPKLVHAIILFVLAWPSWANWASAAELRLATLEYPPYIMNTDHGARGLTIDIVSAAFARIGQPISIDFFPIARGQQKLLSGEVDAFFSIKKTAEREQSMRFTERALMSQDYLFFVRKDSRWRFDGDFAALADARIGVVNATSYGSRFDNAAKANVFRKLDLAADHQTNFRKLMARRIDMVICSRLVGLHYLAELDELNEIVASGPPVETTLSYLAFTRIRDFSELSGEFDRALAEMERDGTLARLKRPYEEPSRRSTAR